MMNKQRFLVQFVAGLALALIAAFSMWHGSILGENTTGIAIVIGIIGISLIATSHIHTTLKKPA